MAAPLRLLVIADVGGDDRRHIGDEAMLEANLDGLRGLRPDVELTLVSQDPSWVGARYGVAGVGLLGFSAAAGAAKQRATLLNRLLAQVADPARDCATVAALRRVDALIVSGGGNLSSSWPDLLYERAALILLAQHLGKAIIVLGQTLGPHLAGDEHDLLARALCAAHFIGVREMPTAVLACRLGIPAQKLWYQTDDAWLLDTADSPGVIDGHLAAPRIAVTVDPQMRAQAPAVFDALVDQLRELARTTGASILLMPHAFGAEGVNAPSDLTEARVLAERLDLPPAAIANGLGAREAKRLTSQAALVLSTRYHPLVFALSAGVPALGIYVDDYCRIKQQGALLHAGQPDWSVNFDEVANGRLLGRALDLWNGRDCASRALMLRRAGWIEAARQRWLAIGRVLELGGENIVVDKSTLFGNPVSDMATGLLVALAAESDARERASATHRDLLERHAQAERLLSHLHQEIGLARTLRRYATALMRVLRLR